MVLVLVSQPLLGARYLPLHRFQLVTCSGYALDLGPSSPALSEPGAPRDNSHSLRWLGDKVHLGKGLILLVARHFFGGTFSEHTQGSRQQMDTCKELLRRYDWTLQTHPKHLRRCLEAQDYKIYRLFLGVMFSECGKGEDLMIRHWYPPTNIRRGEVVDGNGFLGFQLFLYQCPLSFAFLSG